MQALEEVDLLDGRFVDQAGQTPSRIVTIPDADHGAVAIADGDHVEAFAAVVIV